MFGVVAADADDLAGAGGRQELDLFDGEDGAIGFGGEEGADGADGAAVQNAVSGAVGVGQRWRGGGVEGESYVLGQGTVISTSCDVAL